MNQKNFKWRNHLFAELPINVWAIWEKALQPVYLSTGDVVSEANNIPTYVYFPHSTIISLTHMLVTGESIDVAMVGAEGMIGLSVFHGNEAPSNRAIVIRAGLAYRLKADFVREQFESCAHVRHIMLRHTQSLLAQISQVSACTKHHSVEQQICRWLLLYLDRSDDLNVHCTHEQLSLILGVRRERISHVALKLQNLGIISYSRGNIEIQNREELALKSCECYSSINNEYSHLNLTSPMWR
jgi:CRP-like cAMP-binding protein